MRRLRLITLALALCVTFGHNLYAPPATGGIQQIGPNAKAVGPINMNGFQLLNLDTSNLNIGPGGGTGTIDNITLNTPGSLFTGPIIFTISGGLASGTLALANAPAGTVFANLTGGSTTPSWGTLAALKTAMSLNNVDNTTDASKPVSTATSAAIAALTLNGIGAPTGNVSLASHKITNLLDPTSALDATNKQYVDALAAGAPPHAAVAAASTANLTLSGEQTIEGVVTSASRVLVKNQTAGAENGIYVTAAGAWARAADADTGAEVSGNVFVSGGTTNAGTQWGVTTPQPITLNTTPISYTLTGASALYTAGNGITLTGGQFSITQAPAFTLLGNNTSSTGNVLNLNATQVKAMLAIAESDVTNLTSDLAAKASATRSITTAAPLTGGGDLTVNRIFAIPPATPVIDGYLSAIDFATFSAKPPNTRTISTTAPLTGGGDLGANRTISIPPANASTSGYLSTTDWNTFNSKATPDSLFTLTNTGTTGTPMVWAAGATYGVETQVLTVSDKYVQLPSAAAYQAGRRITYTDPVNTSNFGRIFRPAASQFINGAAADFKPFIAGTNGAFGNKTIEFATDGGSNWRAVSSPAHVLKVEDFTDATKSFAFSAAQQIPGTPGLVTAAQGASVTVQPTAATANNVVRVINGDGSATANPLNPTNLVPQVYSIGQTGTDILGMQSTVDNTGVPDTVTIFGNLTGPYSIKWPDSVSSPTTLGYANGETIWLIDASGTVSTDHPVTITSQNGTDTFNGASSVVFDENKGRKAFTSDGNGNWTVSLAKAGIQPYKPIAPSGSNTFTIVCDPSAVEQHARLQLLSGVNNLKTSGCVDGTKFDIFVIQPPSGAAGTLTLPIGSAVGSNGLGLVTLSSANGAKDRLRAGYDGNDGTLNIDPMVLNYTTSATPTAPSGLATGGITASKIDLTWTDNASTETGFEISRCAGSTSCTNYAPIITTAANSTSYSDTALLSSTAYRYRVRAFNAGGYSSYSSPASGTTAAGGAIADLWEVHFNNNAGTTATATVGPDANLVAYADWTTATESGLGAAFNPTAGIAVAGSPTVTNVGTAGTTSYTYKISAFKNSGLHGQATGPLTTATGFATLTASNYNHVSWSAVSGADYYEVYRTASAGTPSDTGRIGVAVTGTTFDDTGIIHNGGIPSDINIATDKHTAVAASPITWGTTVVSLSFWVKSTFSATVGAFIDGGDFKLSGSTSNKVLLTMNGSSGVLTGTFLHNVSSNGSNLDSGTNWHLVIVQFDNATAGNSVANLKVFLDGSSTGQTVTLVTQTRSGALTFNPAAPVVGSTTWSGAIDDVRVYNHALTNTEMSNIFTGDAQ